MLYLSNTQVILESYAPEKISCECLGNAFLRSKIFSLSTTASLAFICCLPPKMPRDGEDTEKHMQGHEEQQQQSESLLPQKR